MSTRGHEQHQKRIYPLLKLHYSQIFLDVCTLSLVAGQEIHRSREDVWEVPFVSGRIVDTQLANTLAFFVKSISRKISWNQFHEFFSKKMWILAFGVILPSLETNTWYGNNFSSFYFYRARRILTIFFPEQSVYSFIASGILPEKLCPILVLHL